MFVYRCRYSIQYSYIPERLEQLLYALPGCVGACGKDGSNDCWFLRLLVVFGSPDRPLLFFRMSDEFLIGLFTGGMFSSSPYRETLRKYMNMMTIMNYLLFTEPETNNCFTINAQVITSYK